MISEFGWQIILIFLLAMVIGYVFYYMSFPYWKRKDFWEKYTWVGIITMYKKIDTMVEPGKKYSTIAGMIFGVTPILFILLIVVLKLLGYL